MEFPNKMNMYPDQRFGQIYSQVNPMMNMGLDRSKLFPK